MTSEEYVSNLLKVSELKKEIKNKFTKQTLQDQGLKQDLTLMYQPVTESQTKNKDALISHLSNLSTESNKKMDEFKETLKNFPDFLKSIDQVKSLLGKPEVVEEKFEDAEDDDGDYDHVLLLAEAKRTDELKEYLAKKSNSDFLLSFVQRNHDINFSTNPWRQIKIADPELHKQLMSVRKSKKGTGIKFLPSGKEELLRELFRLLGSYKSGNKNVFNELNAVVDQLRRNGTISIEQSKRIYKTIS